MLQAALPKPSQSSSNIAPSAPIASGATETPAAGNGSGTHFSLVQMTPQEFDAFQPTFPPGLALTNQDKDSPCKEVIARLSLFSTAQSRGQVRITSGAYTTPWYQLAGGPFTFGIPFPAPYLLGQGELIVEGDADHGILALTPGMELNLGSTSTIRIPVVWAVKPNCT